MVEQRILDAFQMMWGPFPEPVMLIHKDRTVLAVNDLARNAGVPAGIKCFSLNPEIGNDNHCKRCKANLALRTGEPICAQEVVGDKQVIGYWIPLKEASDVYIHFGIGTAEAICQTANQPEQQSDLASL